MKKKQQAPRQRGGRARKPRRWQGVVWCKPDPLDATKFSTTTRDGAVAVHGVWANDGSNMNCTIATRITLTEIIPAAKSSGRRGR